MTTIQNSSRITNGVDVTALGEVIDAIQQQPALAATTFRTHSRWNDDRRVTTTVSGFAACGGEQTRPRPHRLDTDLPLAFKGTDSGPAPLELALSALGACTTTTLVAHAAFKGIELGQLQVDVEGDLDVRGFFGLSDEVRVGCHKIRIDIRVESALQPAELESFVASATRFAPVLDLLRRGNDVEIAINAAGSTSR